MRVELRAALAVGAVLLAGCEPSNLGPADLEGSGRAADRGLGACSEVITFGGYENGAVLSELMSDGGVGPVHIMGTSSDFPGQNAAIIFDTANPLPEADDYDLGSPNETFGGPGIGEGGEMGQPWENGFPLAAVAIIAENLDDGDGDGNIDVPDDGDLPDSFFTIDFSDVGTGLVTVCEITVIDVEPVEDAGTVELFGPGDVLLDTFPILTTGDNGVRIESLGPTGGVEYMIVTLNGSGGIDNIAFEPEEPPLGKIGDYVWCDLNDDGVQDEGEPPIAGVVVEIECELAEGTYTASTTTDADGKYCFEDLEPGTCTVTVDVTTAGDKIPGSNCPTEYVVELGQGEIYLDADFCFIDPPEEGEGCTPGYWKNHPEDWVDYTPGQGISEMFSQVSNYPELAGDDLLTGLEYGGGAGAIGMARNLIRIGIASVLNATSDDVNYPFSESDLIDDINDALASGDRETMRALKGELDGYNNKLPCPL